MKLFIFFGTSLLTGTVTAKFFDCPTEPLNATEKDSITCNLNRNLCEIKVDFELSFYSPMSTDILLTCMWQDDRLWCSCKSNCPFAIDTKTLTFNAAMHQNEDVGQFNCHLITSDGTETQQCSRNRREADMPMPVTSTLAISSSSQEATRSFNIDGDSKKHCENESSESKYESWKFAFLALLVVVVIVAVILAVVCFFSFRRRQLKKVKHGSVKASPLKSNTKALFYQPV